MYAKITRHCRSDQIIEIIQNRHEGKTKHRELDVTE